MASLRQTPPYARFMEKTGWWVEKAGKNFFYLRRLPLLPLAVAKLQGPETPLDFAAIDRLARKHRAWLVKVEPELGESEKLGRDLEKHGYHQSSWIPAVSKTLELDLTKSEEKILAGMRKDARYSLRRAEKKGLQLNKVGFDEFYTAWKKAKPPRIWMPPPGHLQALQKSFGKNFLMLALGRPTVAGVIILLADRAAYYYFAFSSSEGKKLSAPYFLVWQAIRKAKAQGAKIFDFEAIEDDRYPETKAFAGFTHFKKSFGGKEVKYPPSYIKFFNPFIHRLTR